MSVLSRLLGFLWPHRRRAGLAALLAAWTVAANVGLLAVAAYLISFSALKPPFAQLVPAVVVVQILGGSRGFSRYAERMISHDVTFGLLRDMRSWIYSRLVPLAPASLTHARGGDLLSRMVGDVEELQNLYLRALSPLLVAVSVSTLSFVALYAFYPPVAFATLVLLALAGLGVPLLAGALERGAGRRQAGLRASLDDLLVDGVWGVTDLLAAGREPRERKELGELGGRLARLQNRKALATGLRQSLHEMLAGAATLVALLLAIPQVSGGALGGVYLALLALLVLGSFEAVSPLGEAVTALGGSLAAGERIFEVADERPGIEDPARPLPAPAGRDLRVESVTFRYAGEEPALEDVSLALGQGSRVALVGASGAGKSTLAELLMRFHDPESGRVLMDGRDLRNYMQEDVRAAVSVAGQDDHLFDTTVRENLLLARPEAPDRELAAALATAQIPEPPGGLDGRVGEGGSRLSGGERRRLSVARALLKEASLLVLDEPTADLDALTERRLLDAVHDSRRGGLLLITHRLVGLERMDEILVLSEGRVAERGTHADLLRRGGLYARMLGIQERMLPA